MAKQHFVNAVNENIPLDAVDVMNLDGDFPALRFGLLFPASLTGVIVALQGGGAFSGSQGQSAKCLPDL